MKITEIFHSLQGEGIKIGLPTTFVRTSGCNLKCEWCDTRYAWEGGEEMDISDILEKIEEIRCSRVCVTGGEPLLQDDILSFIDIFVENYEVSVETNGSIDISELVERDLLVSMDYKTPSSGMEEEMLDKNLERLRERDQLKFVIADGEDYEFSKDIIERFNPECEVVFQAEEGWDIKEIAESVLEDELEVRVLPQLHKIIWGDRKSV